MYVDAIDRSLSLFLDKERGCSNKTTCLKGREGDFLVCVPCVMSEKGMKRSETWPI